MSEKVAKVIIDTLQAHINTVTEADTTALGRALHVGHMLTVMQSETGDWPAILNVRTGEWIGDERSLEPVPLFQRMTDMLGTTEFDHVLQTRIPYGQRQPIGQSLVIILLCLLPTQNFMYARSNKNDA